MEQTIWKKYRDQGFVLIAVNTGLRTGFAQKIYRESELTTPMLLDIEETVVARYTQLDEGIPPMPLGLLIDRTGAVARIDHTAAADLAVLDPAIAALLAK